MKKGKKV